MRGHAVACEFPAVTSRIRGEMPGANPEPDIAAIAARLIQASDHTPLQHVHCDFSSGVLVLTGFVPSYYLKQLAQERVRHRSSVISVCNLLAIVRTPGS